MGPGASWAQQTSDVTCGEDLQASLVWDEDSLGGEQSVGSSCQEPWDHTCLFSLCCTDRAPTGQCKHPDSLLAQWGADTSQGTDSRAFRCLARCQDGSGRWERSQPTFTEHLVPARPFLLTAGQQICGLGWSGWRWSLMAVQAQPHGKPQIWLLRCLVSETIQRCRNLAFMNEESCFWPMVLEVQIS